MFIGVGEFEMNENSSIDLEFPNGLLNVYTPSSN